MLAWLPYSPKHTASGSVDPPLTGLVARYRADLGVTDAGGGAVSAWADQSGNGYTLSQGTSANRPTVQSSQINGHPAIVFDGVNDILSRSSTPSMSQPYSGVAVFRSCNIAAHTYNPLWSEDSGDNQLLISRGTGGNGQVAIYAGGSSGVDGPANSAASHTWMWAIAIMNGASGAVYLNGVSYASGDAGSGAHTGLHVGAYNGGGDAGDWVVAELIFYDHALDSGERSALAAYVAAYYGL